MKKTLVLVGHTNYENSFYNKKLVESLAGLPNITTHIIKEDFKVEEEQKLLMEHDNIVLQFPFHWFDMPFLFKSWVDKVVLYGFAYGPDGDKLENKNFLISITTNSVASAYTHEGHNKATIDELLAPTKATIRFVRGNLKGIFAIHGAAPEGSPNKISDSDLAKKLAEYKTLVSSL
ncbi:MAG: NAD(P)H-dependent oxidoreductase [Alphaproteobacteria bacterium]|jgi:glutathione-regulated potassium-efflux system ancillary protein KefG|nr:NAD(P)H-dependent oxidoreductase [Alphaproteobacteria bacterium]